jgi:hypothetical protein
MYARWFDSAGKIAWPSVVKFLLLAIMLYALYFLKMNGNFPVILDQESLKRPAVPAMYAFQKFSIGVSYLFLATGSVLFASVLIPVRYTKPSDFFLLFYGLLVLIPFATLYPIRGAISPADFVLYFSVLGLPALMVYATAFFFYPIHFPKWIDLRTLIRLMALFCLISMALALRHAPVSASFDYFSVYVRRMEGRAIYLEGTLPAYLNMMTINGFAPFLAFIAAWQYRVRWFVFALACSAVYFYLIGIKSSLFYIFLAVALGYAVRVRKIYILSRILTAFLLIVFALALAQYWIFRDFWISDYFVERTFFVPPYIISGYFDFMRLPPDLLQPAWTLFEGIGEASSNIAFLVGKWLFPMATANNANTNTFIYKLAAGGIPLYAVTVLLVAGFYALLNNAYAASRSPLLIYVGVEYGILLTEQSATTALLSSGMGVIAMLCVFTRFVPDSSSEYTTGKGENNPPGHSCG